MTVSAPKHSKCGILNDCINGTDRIEGHDVVRCVHCGYVWCLPDARAMSRGFCMTCNGYVCGHRASLSR